MEEEDTGGHISEGAAHWPRDTMTIHACQMRWKTDAVPRVPPLFLFIRFQGVEVRDKRRPLSSSKNDIGRCQNVMNDLHSAR